MSPFVKTVSVANDKPKCNQWEPLGSYTEKKTKYKASTITRICWHNQLISCHILPFPQADPAVDNKCDCVKKEKYYFENFFLILRITSS